MKVIEGSDETGNIDSVNCEQQEKNKVDEELET
jgi:hypothetical protein